MIYVIAVNNFNFNFNFEPMLLSHKLSFTTHKTDYIVHHDKKTVLAYRLGGSGYPFHQSRPDYLLTSPLPYHLQPFRISSVYSLARCHFSRDCPSSCVRYSSAHSGTLQPRPTPEISLKTYGSSSCTSSVYSSTSSLTSSFSIPPSSLPPMLHRFSRARY